MIDSIPTRYRGTRFRSRLEARWAAMFDLLGWPYAYEPIDLDGYIPDYLLLFPEPVLVEVKPFATMRIDPDIVGYQVKIETGGWAGEALLLGCALHETLEGVDVGWLRSAHWRVWAPAQISWHRDHWSPSTDEGRWGCRSGACWPVDRTDAHRGLHFDHRTRLLRLWAEAGNRVQYKAPRG